MTGLEDRQVAASNILMAHSDGARLHLACEIVGIDVRTLQRWKAGEGLVDGDGRPGAVRPVPAHALSPAERAQVLSVATLPVKPVLHGDNGATLKATTVLAMLYWLGVKPSYSRPRVSDDNAYAESLFRTAKYRPEFPAKGFVDLAATRAWATNFVRWYNVDHRHSGIRYVSPTQRHAGEDHAILAARHELYVQARERNPARWSRDTRNWAPIGAVTLNPERDSIVAMAAATEDIQPLAA